MPSTPVPMRTAPDSRPSSPRSEPRPATGRRCTSSTPHASRAVGSRHSCSRSTSASARGIKIVYKSVPEADPITEMLLKSIFQAMDEFHSMVSRAKGLAGMAENITRGGGPAVGPRSATGSSGSRPAPSATASPLPRACWSRAPMLPTVQAYLKRSSARRRTQPARDNGRPGPDRHQLAGRLWSGMPLTYAGHTVWNRHADQGGGVKRRPRADWLDQTRHPPGPHHRRRGRNHPRPPGGRETTALPDWLRLPSVRDPGGLRRSAVAR